MLTLPSSVRVYLATDATDLRKGFDGLSAATRHVIRQDPLSGHMFVFINRRRNRMKILVWQTSGFLLLYKRLEHGTFKLPHAPRPGEKSLHIDAADLALMLEGIDLRGAKRRKRWAPPNSVASSIGA